MVSRTIFWDITTYTNLRASFSTKSCNMKSKCNHFHVSWYPLFRMFHLHFCMRVELAHFTLWAFVKDSANYCLSPSYTQHCNAKDFRDDHLWVISQGTLGRQDAVPYSCIPSWICISFNILLSGMFIYKVSLMSHKDITLSCAPPPSPGPPSPTSLQSHFYFVSPPWRNIPNRYKK